MGAESANPNIGHVYHIMHAGNGAGLPTTQEMEAWIDNYGLFNPTLSALDSAEALQVLEKRECTFLVETTNMTIQWKLCTCTSGACEPSIVPGLEQLDMALANQ